MVAVWYLVMGISTSIIGETNADFSDQNGVAGIIKAGKWETKKDCINETESDFDCSSLSFVESVSGVEEEIIFVEIINIGENMTGSGHYEVYFSENDNLKEGTPVTELLTFSPLAKEEKLRLSFIPKKSGTYKFKVYQHPAHPAEKEIWSRDINVTLNEQEETSNSNDQETSKEKQEDQRTTQKEESFNRNESVEQEQPKNEKPPAERQENKESIETETQNQTAPSEKTSAQKDKVKTTGELSDETTVEKEEVVEGTETDAKENDSEN